MSRRSAALLFVVLLAVGGVVAYFVLRPTRPGELDIAAKDLPQLPPVEVAAGDWPWWRGPTRDNHADGPAPTSWGEGKNVAWKSPVPGRGHSSPILVGDRIFLTSADEAAQKQLAFGYDRTTGEKLWEKTIHEKNFTHKHSDNSYASGTPASDGKRVFVVFANNKAIHVTALDLEGNVLWSKEAGPHQGGSASHGSGTSVALWGSFVYVADDSPGKGWIAALHRESGEFGWRQGRKTGAGSYGSPVIGEFDSKPLVLIAGNGNVAAYDPLKGDLLWERSGIAEVSGNSVTVAPNMLFASSGYPQRKLLALRPDGSVAWKKDKGDNIPYPPSMVWDNGFLYIVSDGGMATCYDAENGDEKWKERLDGSFYSSPLVAGKNVYACSREGTTAIFAAGPDGFEEVARNKLDGAINASPVAAQGRLYIRTATHLYCIGEK
jgi:outer membrane protein assembly factor BamB